MRHSLKNNPRRARPLKPAGLFIALPGLVFSGLFLSGCFSPSVYHEPAPLLKPKRDAVLSLSVTDAIGRKTAESFMKRLRFYAGDEKIKGVLIRMDSPGGSVGASQEINAAIKAVRSVHKKPVLVSAGDVMASGAVLSAASADQIFVNPGTLFGSIGVIAQFENMEELLRFAKVDVYHIKSGEFKDSGNSYRKMTLREREMFESMTGALHNQFKTAIIEGRGLKPELVEQVSDGRIFTGEEAVKLGLADKTGNFNEAVQAIGTLSGLGSDPYLFTPQERGAFLKDFKDYFENSLLLDLAGRFFSRSSGFRGKPLFILPSYLTR